MQRSLRRGGGVVMILAAAAGIAACGGSSKPAVSASKLLSQTLNPPSSAIRSGNLSLTLNAQLNGIAALDGQPVSLNLSGPFVAGSPVTSSKFDFSATIDYAGETIPFTVISTGKAAYVQFGGTYYVLPPSITSRLFGSAAGTSSSEQALLGKLGIKPRNWLTNARIVGGATVGGVATTHLTAQLDVAKMLGDVATFISHAAALPGATSLSRVSRADLSQLSSAIHSANVDIYSGASDHIIREFKFALSFTVPPIDQSSVYGLTGGSVTLDVTLTNLNAPETITAPTSSEPLSDLLGSSSPLSALAGG